MTMEANTPNIKPLELKHFTLRGPGRTVYCCGALPPADAPEDRKKMAILIVHGFASSKEGPMAQKMLEYAASRGYGAVAMDFPAHGPHKEENGELSLSACKGNVMMLEEYIKRNLPGAAICYFGSSFGAYITLLRLLDIQKQAAIVEPDPEPTCAFLRSAAVNMPDLILRYDNFFTRLKLKKDGYLMSIGGPDTIRLTTRYFDDLKENDLPSLCRALIREKAEAMGVTDPASMPSLQECLDTPIRMVHATTDKIIRPNFARDFAEEFDIPLTWFEGEDHTLSTFPETPDAVCDMAWDFFLRSSSRLAK